MERNNSYKAILDAISGYKIEFTPGDFPPKVNKPGFPHKICDEEAAVIDAERSKFKKEKCHRISHHEVGQFVSPIFKRPKKAEFSILLNYSGSFRI